MTHPTERDHTPQTPDSEAAAAWDNSRLAALPDDFREAMLPSARVREIAAGERIRSQTDPHERPVSGLGIVITGQAAVFMRSEGRSIAVRYLGPGNMFGLAPTIAPDFAVLGSQVETWAVKLCKVMCMPPGRFRTLAQGDAKVAWTVASWLVEDVIEGYAVILDNTFLPIRKLLARHLLDLATPDGADWVVSETQEELADIVGSVRPVVARALRELRDLGLVARDERGLVLLDRQTLHSLGRRD